MMLLKMLVNLIKSNFNELFMYIYILSIIVRTISMCNYI